MFKVGSKVIIKKISTIRRERELEKRAIEEIGQCGVIESCWSDVCIVKTNRNDTSFHWKYGDLESYYLQREQMLELEREL